MKKISILLVAILLSGSLFAQKSTPAETNASKIIGMTNGVVSLYNSYLSQLSKAREGLNTAEENRVTLTDNINRSASSWSCSYILIRDDQMAEYEKAAKAAPTFPEKMGIQTGIKYIQSNTERLSNHCKALNEYFVKKEYKEDVGFAKYQPLYDSLAAVYNDVSKMWASTIQSSSDAGDRSELLLLKKSPIAQFIIPMKTDLVLVSKLIDKYSEDELDFETIQKDIEALKKITEKNKSLTGKNVAALEKHSSKNNFEGFYGSMDDFIETAVKLEKMLNPATTDKEDRHINDRIKVSYSQLKNRYSSLVSSYNLM